MNRLLALSACLAGILAAGPAAGQDGCEHQRQISDAVELPAGGRVSIRAEAGSLRVVGRAEGSQVLVTGIACASSASRLDALTVETEASGGEVRVVTEIPQARGWLNREPERIDLVVEVPERSRVEIVDGSGSAEITGVRGGLRIEDGSGSLEITNVAGDLHVDDGSGSLAIRDVDGAVVLLDGSGSMDIENVRGSVTVEEDGSGSMVIRDVTGSVHIREDGSGGIQVERAGGDFTVDRGGSGGIHFADVAGAVQIPRD